MARVGPVSYTHLDVYKRQDLSSLYQQQNDLVSSIRCLRKAKEAAPQNSQVCARLGDLVADTKAKEEATALYQEAINLDPGHVVVRDKLRAVAGPVSYTHLDVYKRQVEELGEVLQVFGCRRC